MRKNPQPAYLHLALGGTFDHFHQGHHYLLTTAFTLSSQVTIGVTDDHFAGRLHGAENLQTCTRRIRELGKFLKSKNLLQRTRIIKLKDLYGTAATDSTLEALLVTSNTLKGGQLINQKRKTNKLQPLKIEITPLLKSEDGKNISSTRIRKGEIDRQGNCYAFRLKKAGKFNLPSKHRNLFRRPFGKIFSGSCLTPQTAVEKLLQFLNQSAPHFLIAVGDVVSPSMLASDNPPQLVIVDLHVKRQRQFKQVSEIGELQGYHLYRTKNPPGKITDRLITSIQKLITAGEKALLLVEGEEDLAVLPCTLLAPLGSIIIYGHFKYGVIAVTVTEQKKKQALSLLDLFS